VTPFDLARAQALHAAARQVVELAEIEQRDITVAEALDLDRYLAEFDLVVGDRAD